MPQGLSPSPLLSQFLHTPTPGPSHALDVTPAGAEHGCPCISHQLHPVPTPSLRHTAMETASSGDGVTECPGGTEEGKEAAKKLEAEERESQAGKRTAVALSAPPLPGSRAEPRAVISMTISLFDDAKHKSQRGLAIVQSCTAKTPCGTSQGAVCTPILQMSKLRFRDGE